MTKYAAYDENSIYGIGDTADAAVANARQNAKEPDAQYQTAPITNEFAAWIDENGWDGMSRSFEVDQSGHLRDTTNAA